MHRRESDPGLAAQCAHSRRGFHQGRRWSAPWCSVRGGSGHRPDCDVDLALIFEHANAWRVLDAAAGFAYDVSMDTPILVRPVRISAQDRIHPQRAPRPDLLRSVARERHRRAHRGHPAATVGPADGRARKSIRRDHRGRAPGMGDGFNRAGNYGRDFSSAIAARAARRSCSGGGSLRLSRNA